MSVPDIIAMAISGSSGVLSSTSSLSACISGCRSLWGCGSVGWMWECVDEGMGRRPLVIVGGCGSVLCHATRWWYVLCHARVICVSHHVC
jgi:hypothetical protein